MVDFDPRMDEYYPLLTAAHGNVKVRVRQSMDGKALIMTGLLGLPAGQPVLRVAPMPADVNAAGDIFGGWVMAHVDIAGGIVATQRARGRVATVAVNSFQFKQPVSVGDVVSFYADVIEVGRTSITVDVSVYAERNPASPLVVKVTEAKLTFVALDREGVKRLVPAAVS
jgi:acyl-CoA thioesterase YciA